MSDQKQPEKEPDLTNESKEPKQEEMQAELVEPMRNDPAYYQYMGQKLLVEKMDNGVKRFFESQENTAKIKAEAMDKHLPSVLAFGKMLVITGSILFSIIILGAFITDNLSVLEKFTDIILAVFGGSGIAWALCQRFGKSVE